MKKLVLSLAFVLSFTTLASAKEAVLCTVTAPEGANLEQYPTSSGPLSSGQMYDLGLRPIRLTKPTLVYNFHRRAGCAGGTWDLETLPAGMMGLGDKDGNILYKESCGNRLVVVPAKAQAAIIPVLPNLPTAPAPPATAKSATNKFGGMSFWNIMNDIFLFLLGAALVVAFALLLWWALSHLFDWLRNNAPIQPVGPAPVLVTPRPIPVGPVPVRTTRRYGPFMEVTITDLGAAGFQVIADGHDLGGFNANQGVTTEDAGHAGHYVVVTT